MHPQVFHRSRVVMASQWWRMRFCTVAAAIVVLLAGAGSVHAQALGAATTYRVFLKNGHALASYGDTARVGDRIIFNLPIIGADNQLSLQLVSLPLSAIDLERTDRYAETMRAAYYAATRGEADYLEMTSRMTVELGRLPSMTDPTQQLAAAERLRADMLAWPKTHFYYRVDDVDRFAVMFADAINEMRAAAGLGGFALDLSAGITTPVREPLLPAPGATESITLAVVAARAADISEERIAVLRAALGLVPVSDARLRRDISTELEQEVAADRAYLLLAKEFRARAEAAVKRGSVQTAERLRDELPRRDRQLGQRRAETVQALAEELDRAVEMTRTRRAALDRYHATLRTLLIYERRVRSAMSAFDGFGPLLGRIRDMSGAEYEPTLSAEARFRQLQLDATAIAPPDDVAGVHATLISALQMAVEACARRRQAAATTKGPVASQASTAAAAALMLAERAHADLVTALFPPRVQ